MRAHRCLIRITLTWKIISIRSHGLTRRGCHFTILIPIFDKILNLYYNWNFLFIFWAHGRPHFNVFLILQYIISIQAHLVAKSWEIFHFFGLFYFWAFNGLFIFLELATLGPVFLREVGCLIVTNCVDSFLMLFYCHAQRFSPRVSQIVNNNKNKILILVFLGWGDQNPINIIDTLIFSQIKLAN